MDLGPGGFGPGTTECTPTGTAQDGGTCVAASGTTPAHFIPDDCAAMGYFTAKCCRCDAAASGCDANGRADISGGVAAVCETCSATTVTTFCDGQYTTQLECSLQRAGAFTTQGPGGNFSHENLSAYDFDCPLNTEIYPAVAGRVSDVWTDANGAHVVEITDSAGRRWWYAHFSDSGWPVVSVGQQVALSDRIGSANCTGFCTGDHVHIEIRNAGSVSEITNALDDIGWTLDLTPSGVSGHDMQDRA